MKPIIINEANRDRIIIAIDEAQSRAKVRAIDFTDVEYAVKKIEEKLGITKKAMVGVKATVDPWAQEFPKAYKYTPYSTQFSLEKTTSGWKLTKVYRSETRRKTYDIELTDDAKMAIIKNHERFNNV